MKINKQTNENKENINFRDAWLRKTLRFNKSVELTLRRNTISPHPRSRASRAQRFALAFAFLKNASEKACFASYGKYVVYLTSCCSIFPVFKYFRRSDLAQPFRMSPPGFRTPRRFVDSAVSSFASQAYFWESRLPEIRMCLQAGRLHDRTVDLPAFPILFREKLRIYMQES